jgi:hypothetical protein
MTTAHQRIEPHRTHGAGSSHEELSAAQRAAVNAEAHLIVVQGGPGTGKTEAALARITRLATSLRQDAAWLLALVTSDAKVQPFRRRLARSLVAAGCAESVVERTTACVVSVTALGAASAGFGVSPAGLANFASSMGSLCFTSASFMFQLSCGLE